MDEKPLRLILPVCVVLLMLASPVSAQSDGGASLSIRFVNGATQFHVGEVIPIELAFSASVSDTYDMSTRNYDRSGRTDMESFHVTPSGRDPLHRYYSNGVFMGGGFGSSRLLTSEPAIMREDLNEWLALDQPGYYTLYVTTRRISRRAAIRSEAVELRSNALEFEVVPADSAWQDSVLRSAMSVLDNTDSADEAKQAAMRSLRFVDSPASVTELVRQMSFLRGDAGSAEPGWRGPSTRVSSCVKW